jgi:hypothetical protein
MVTTGALFYPFHLCHGETLRQLLAAFSRVHFRDYMALQVSPFFGTTAYPDRMGDTYPDLVTEGRLVQGYHVSGTLSPRVIAAVDRDLSDSLWRDLFHAALAGDHRFQIGLFGTSSGASRANLPRMDERLRSDTVTVAQIRRMSESPRMRNDAEAFDYRLALLKTSAALVYTVQLAVKHELAAATDSPAHFALLNRTLGRDGLTLENRVIERAGY